MISAGVDVNAPDSPESGNRALHWAVCFGKPEAVQCLIGKERYFEIQFLLDALIFFGGGIIELNINVFLARELF